LTDRPRTSLDTLARARRIGLEAGLRYVYEGNVPGEGGENTYCPGCRQLLIERNGFYLLQNRIVSGKCPDCNIVVDGVDM
jgi:pyruvate formate lyase activating enzyme